VFTPSYRAVLEVAVSHVLYCYCSRLTQRPRSSQSCGDGSQVEAVPVGRQSFEQGLHLEVDAEQKILEQRIPRSHPPQSAGDFPVSQLAGSEVPSSPELIAKAEMGELGAILVTVEMMMPIQVAVQASHCLEAMEKAGVPPDFSVSLATIEAAPLSQVVEPTYCCWQVMITVEGPSQVVRNMIHCGLLRQEAVSFLQVT